jgi:hypothetical protein
MTRLSTATPHGKKNLPNIGRQNRQHMKPDDAWQRKPSMAAYYRPKQRGRIDIDMDDEQDMDMDAPHDA